MPPPEFMVAWLFWVALSGGEAFQSRLDTQHNSGYVTLEDDIAFYHFELCFGIFST
jgi:hypothetical protein